MDFKVHLDKDCSAESQPLILQAPGSDSGFKLLIVLIPTEALLPAQGSTSSFGSLPHKTLDGRREDTGSLPGSTYALAPWLI